jgi:hypothetical protein
MGAKRGKPKLPRVLWTRNPVQKAHSTSKGAKGYSREAAKKELRDQTKGKA